MHLFYLREYIKNLPPITLLNYNTKIFPFSVRDQAKEYAKAICAFFEKYYKFAGKPKAKADKGGASIIPGKLDNIVLIYMPSKNIYKFNKTMPGHFNRPIEVDTLDPLHARAEEILQNDPGEEEYKEFNPRLKSSK